MCNAFRCNDRYTHRVAWGLTPHRSDYLTDDGPSVEVRGYLDGAETETDSILRGRRITPMETPEEETPKDEEALMEVDEKKLAGAFAAAPPPPRAP